MPRRASSSVNPLWTLGAVIAILAASIAGGYFLYGFVSDPYRTLEPLDVGSYLENSSSMRQNVYKLNCTVDNQLAWSREAGRLISVETDPGGDILPVLVPAKLNDVNIQKGQRFFLRITGIP
jgi:hypothetical protein